VRSPSSHAVDFSAADFVVVNGPLPPPTTAPNQPPVANFGKFRQASPRWINAAGTPSVDSDGTITKYEWRWGDGSRASIGKTSWHHYAHAGWYRIRLTVTDDDGASTTRGIWYRVN
jgi:hypothetical protein